MIFGLFRGNKPYKATINPSGQVIEVQPGENLLAAGLDAGFPWPHDCRAGSCGTCRCRLIKGRIKRMTDFSFTLDRGEIKKGLILACQTHLKSDVIIDVEMSEGD